MSLWHEVLYRPIFNTLILIYHFIPDIGIAIILITVITRLILYPFQAKALRAQKEMQALQPKLQKLQDKYKNDKQKQAKAVMEFYKTHKVNPASSCLVTLVQLPIIIALYQVFRTGLDTSRLNQLYSFIPKPETINPMFLGLVNLAHPERYVLPILAGLTQFIQAKMMMPKNQPAKTGNAMQGIMTKQMVYFMPLMIVFFAASLPAALPLYWIVVSLFGILQQYMINKEKPRFGKVKVRVKG